MAAVQPETPLVRVLERLEGVKAAAGGYMAKCPAHDDQQASLKVDEAADGSVLLFCHAGCATPHILSAMGLAFWELFAKPAAPVKATSTLGEVVATYDYYALDGTLLYQSVRYAPKTFRQRRPDGTPGGWKWDLTPFKNKKVPYRWPQLQGRTTVFVVEGEKDVDRLWEVGVAATTNSGGALKWGKNETRCLKQVGVQRVIILPDNDDPGKSHAELVAASVHAAGLTATIIELPGLAPHGDVSDWLNAGHTKAELEALAAKPYPVNLKATAAPAPATAFVPPAPASGPTAYHKTDLGNAEAFRDRFSDRVRYDHRHEEWLSWDTHVWNRHADAKVRKLAHEHVRQWQKEVAAAVITFAEKEEWKQYLLRLERSGAFECLFKEAQVLAPLAVDGGWDIDPYLLGCRNGVLNLKTGVLRDGQPEDRVTMQTATAYDPVAACPRWVEFLAQVFEDDAAMLAFVQRAVGYSLTGDISEQCFFMAHGTGANGKSTLLVTLDHVFGDYAHTTDIRTFTGGDGVTYELAQLDGRRLILTSEARTRSHLNEQVLKNFTGGERVEAQHKYGHPFRFHPIGKIWFAVNHAPKVSDESEGFWRRVRMIPFARTFPEGERDKTLLAKLKTEATGILTWAVQGCLQWQQHGLNPPDRVVVATAEYQEAEDPLAAFLTECCVIAPGVSVTRAAAYSAYDAWASANRMADRDGRVNGFRFGQLMERRFEKVKAKRGVRYSGVMLRDDRTDEMDEVDD